MLIPIEVEKRVAKQEYRSKVSSLKERIEAMPESLGENPFPLKHTFADGVYIREIFMPKGMLVVSKIHKCNHPYFVLKGKCSVLTEEGITRIQAPFHSITKAGTQRVLYIHEDTTWITVHQTHETDLEKIEEEIIAKNFEELDNSKIEAFVIEAKRGE